MPEISPHQLLPESGDKNTWLEELNTPETRKLVIAHIFSMKADISVEDTEDIAQLVMLNAAKAIQADKFRGESKLTTWLYRITKNEVLSLLRKKKRSAKIGSFPSDFEPASEALSSEEKYLTAETTQYLKTHLNKLSPTLRQVMELRLEDLDYKQIAERLGISLAAVKSREFRARMILIQRMQNEGK